MEGQDDKSGRASDLDEIVNSQIKAYQSIVSNWLKGSTVKKGVKPAATQPPEFLNPTGRPARYNISFFVSC